MPEIRTQFLMDMHLQVEMPMTLLGDTQYGERRIAKVLGGSFEGPRLKGKVHPGGGDWILNRIDGVTQLDVRLTMETHDGAQIYMTYRGLRHGPADVMAKLNAGQPVDPSLIYFRTTPYFETAKDGPYAWLNRSCFVSLGRREPTGPIYQVFEVL